MSAFKEKYTQEELQELTDWFKERMNRLPQKLELEMSTKTNNLPFTVERLLTILTRSNFDVSFSGYVAHLYKIRERLLENGFE